MNRAEIERLTKSYEDALSKELEVSAAHSYADAKKIMREFEDFLGNIGVKPIFVGLGNKSADFFIKCGVPTARMRQMVPSEFGGLHVQSSLETFPTIG